MESHVFEAVNLVQSGCPSFFKFIAANETGDTGGISADSIYQENSQKWLWVNLVSKGLTKMFGQR
jgi:hypothetical protein